MAILTNERVRRQWIAALKTVERMTAVGQVLVGGDEFANHANVDMRMQA
ncbi:MAG: hypothetical protein KDA92_05175 [Planctomycetales bacterium]|nr:hypothetical protein [Planctomycetales bacterium]MCA9167421.1 hypothetical protein [Planctomycetales bacterium]